ncbi:TRAP transporter small permease subunit [Chloroflexota bacterium]
MRQGKDPLRFVKIIDLVSKRWGIFVSYGVLLMLSITVFEVVMRYVFNNPTFWGHETTEMLYGAYIMLAASYTIHHRVSPAHIKMDVFYMKLSDRKKAVIELFASILFFAFVGTLVWQGWEMALRATKLLEHSASVWNPPIYPLKWCIPIGSFLLFVQGVAKFIRNLNMVITGREIA